MREYAEALYRMRSALVGPEGGKLQEDFDFLTFDCALEKDSLRLVDSGVFEEIGSTFGECLDLEIQEVIAGEVESVLRPAAIAAGEFESWVNDLPAGSSCRVTLTVDKEKLLRATFGSVDGRVVLLFYETRFLTALDGDLGRLEDDWFSEDQRLILLLGRPHCRLEGPVCSVLGGMEVDDVRSAVQDGLSQQYASILEDRPIVRAAHTHWQGGPRFLLPEHLYCVDRGIGPDTVIKPALNRRLMDVVIGSLANYTVPSGSSWSARFEGRKRLEVDLARRVTVTDGVCKDWYEIYTWVYDGRTRDKLAIVRNLLTLQPYDEDSGNLSVITSHSAAIRASAQDHYERFVGDSVKEYFDKLKEAMAQMQSRVDAIGQQIAALTDAFVKNLLATTVFLVTTVLSNLLNPSKGSKAAPVIAVAFALYIVLVLSFYYPVMWRTRCLNLEDYHRGRKGYTRLFAASDLDEFIGEAFDQRDRLFQLTFWSTLALYVVLGLSGLGYAVSLFA